MKTSEWEMALNRASIHIKKFGSDSIEDRYHAVFMFCKEMKPYIPKQVAPPMFKSIIAAAEKPQGIQPKSTMMEVVRLTMKKVRLLQQNKDMDEQLCGLVQRLIDEERGDV